MFLLLTTSIGQDISRQTNFKTLHFHSINAGVLPKPGDESKSKIPPKTRLPPYFQSNFWSDFTIYRSLPHAKILKNPKWTNMALESPLRFLRSKFIRKILEVFFWNIGQGNSSFLNHHACRQNITKRNKLQQKPAFSRKKDFIYDYIGLDRKRRWVLKNGCSINETAFLLQLDIVVNLLRCFKKLPSTNSYCISCRNVSQWVN